MAFNYLYRALVDVVRLWYALTPNELEEWNSISR